MTHHHHDHDHHDHPHDKTPLTFEEKMVKLLEHWIAHNDDHARSYREWAEKATGEGISGAGALLTEAAEMTLEISEKFRQALSAVKDGD